MSYERTKLDHDWLEICHADTRAHFLPGWLLDLHATCAHWMWKKRALMAHCVQILLGGAGAWPLIGPFSVLA